MKYKLGLTLIFVAMLAFAGFANADVSVTRTADVNFTVVPGATKMVIGAFTLQETTGSVNDVIDAFKVTDTGNGAGSSVAGKVKKLYIYQDKNNNQELDANDVLIPTATVDVPLGTNMATAPVSINLTTKKAIEKGVDGKIYVLVVADINGYCVGGWIEGTTKLGADLDVSNTGGNAGFTGAGPLLGSQTARDVEVTATHLKWVSAGYKHVVVSGANIANGGNLLTAVDDYGNLDPEYTAAGVRFKLERFTDGVDLTSAQLTAVDGAGAPVGMRTIDDGVAPHAAGVDAAVAAGIVVSGTAGGDIAAGKLKTLSISTTSSAAYVLVAVANRDATSKGLQGSTTVYVTSALPAQFPVATGVDPSRGIEVYDTDHNGHIDHMTIFFNGAVKSNNAQVTDFQVTGNYSIKSVKGPDFDAGGVGIRNAGDFGFTVELVENTDAYDTDVTPDLALLYNDKVRSSLNDAAVSAFGFALAKEVDKARPVLVSAITKDSGFGGGTASNGILDGLALTFSEPVRNITIGSNLIEDPNSYVGLALPVASGMSLVGSVGTNGTTYTIPVGETIINTGVKPTILYNEDYAAARITDNARSATGAISYNDFYASNLQFNLKDTDAQIATTDGAPMVVHSVETLDENPKDGRIDRIRVTFSETISGASTENGVDFFSSTAAFSSADRGDGVYVPSGRSISGSIMTFDVTPVSVDKKVFDTEAAPSFRYNPNADNSNIADAAGNELVAYGPGGLPSPATRDMAAPIIVKVISADAYTDTAFVGDSTFEAAGPNGRLDTATLIFSEKVQTTGGAQNGGTALDNAISQFAINHQNAGARTVLKTTDTFGAPVWADKDNAGDTSTELTISFKEIAHDALNNVNGGDTGKTLDVDYGAITASYNIRDLAAEPNAMASQNGFVNATLATFVDGAAPMIIDGIGKNWLGNGFANVLTYDAPKETGKHGAQNADDGDGYLEGFKLKFTENVKFFNSSDVLIDTVDPAAIGTKLKQFKTTLPGSGVLTFNDASADIDANPAGGSNVVTLTGKRSTVGDPDTGTTPSVTYTKDDSVLRIKDLAGNLLATFENKPSFDNARPVIVGIYGTPGVQNKLDITFSEQVYAHDADGKSISFNAAGVTSSALFGYTNNGTGPGSSGFTSAAVTQPAPNMLQATLNANLQTVDIEKDLVWVRTSGVFDDADAVEENLADNEVLYVGAVKFWIMDDVIAPYIIGAKTIDYDLDGKIDHIRIKLSEPIIDSSLKGFVSKNAMSNDVSATWKLSGYTGPARWNLFDGASTDSTKVRAGRAASIAAGKPAFTDNAENDDVLYLELDEELVPANVNSGIGSTGFKPAITWGTGADAETLGDARPNLLNTNVPVVEPYPAAGLKPTNGTVEDKVGPVIVGATYDSASKTVTVLFSEPVKNNTKTFDTSDFAVVGGSNATIWGYSWTNDSTVKITMKSNYAPATDGITTVAVTNGTNYASLADAGDNVAGLGTDVNNGAIWQAGSPVAASGPYTIKTITRNAFTFQNQSYIYWNSDGSTGATVKAGASITYNFKYANVDSVDVYVSYNSGLTYELVPGSRVDATLKKVVLPAKMAVNKIKVQSATNSSVKFERDITVYYDGNVVGASIGAPSDLKISDVPGDNGGFVVAKFKVSADHLTAVNSYYFYRQMVLGTADTTWVLWATAPAGTVDAKGYQAVIVPTANNKTSKWAAAATTTKVVSNQVMASKEAEVAVAEVVYDEAGAAKAAVDVVSAMSNEVEAAAIDNIAPSAISTIKAESTTGNGVSITWTAPADHGIVASYTLAGTTGFVYGVDKYEVYRKTGTGEFALVGEAPKGSTSYVDNVAAGSAIYNYMIKAVDSAFSVQTLIPGNVMSTSAVVGDLNGDNSVGLGDLVLLGSYWDVKSTDAKFVSALDLNKDGVIQLGDLVLLGNAWTPAVKAAKAAPASNVAFNMNAEFNADNTTYFVTINAQDNAGINGVGFELKYDANKYEFVSESVSGLSGDVKIVKADQGVIDVASFYGNDKFNGITLGFKAKGQISEMNVEMVNAEVAINSEVNTVANAQVTLKAVPTVYSLSQNIPNPFNPTTTIAYSIPKAGNVSLVVYNIAGQKVRTLVNANQTAAFYRVVWNGKNDNGESVATGMYFYKLVSGNYSKIVKMTLMK